MNPCAQTTSINSTAMTPKWIERRLFTVGLILFSLSWLLAEHYKPWLSFQSEAIAFLSVTILFASLSTAKSDLLGPHIINWIAFASFLPWIQYACGTFRYASDALQACFYLSGLLMAVLVGYRTAPQTNSSQMGWLGLAYAILISALISSAIGLAQWLDQAEQFGSFVVQTDGGARAAGNLAQPNQLATLILMGIAAVVYIYEQRRIGKTALYLAVAFMTIVLVLTQSRASLVSVVVTSIFLLWKKNYVQFYLSRKAIVGWLLSAIVATLCLPSLSEALMLGGSRSLTATGSINERWLIWKQVVYAIVQAPWFGYGWNQTSSANAVGALSFPGSTTYTYAHNIFLDLMVWCGVPMGLLLTGVMGYWMFSRMRSVKKPDAVLAMAALLPIAVHSMLEFPFAYAYFLISAGFFIGIVESARTPVKVVAIKVHWLWGFLCVWTSIGAYMAYEYLQIEEDFRIVRFENLRVGTTPASYEVPHVWMLSHMAAMLNAARQVPRLDMPKTDLENLRKVSDRFAYGAIRFKYAQALGLNGDPAGAAKQMQIIHGLYGDFYYQACKDELIRLSNEKFPQLKSVKLP